MNFSCLFPDFDPKNPRPSPEYGAVAQRQDTMPRSNWQHRSTKPLGTAWPRYRRPWLGKHPQVAYLCQVSEWFCYSWLGYMIILYDYYMMMIVIIDKW